MNDEIRDRIRTIPDYPKPGIMFRDVTTLWNDARGFRTAIDLLVQPYAGVRIDKVAGIEARGFVIGGAVAHQLSVGFIPIRKQNKLPGATIGEDYDLEYGTDRVEIHDDAITEGQNVLIVDDLLATGGTAEAAVKLIRRAGGTVVGCCFIVDLPDLGGMKRLQDMGLSVMALCAFEGE
ncbi:MAG: adenine phosphoribosyltransferase [Minwuia sp.]|nr:adenine phosphoribosyltransferase [Minwuia sp.]